MSNVNNVDNIKINNRKAAHSQHPQVLRTKRLGSGKGGWGDPMDDLKYLSQESIRPQDPNDPNYEDEVDAEEARVAAAVASANAAKKKPADAVPANEVDYFQNFQSDVESLSAFKVKVEELVNDYLYDKDEEKFTVNLLALNCPNFFNQVPKLLLWTVIASKKQEHFPATRNLMLHLRSTETVSKVQLESAFRRLFHRLNELSMLNSNAYIILVDFGEYCVARNLLDDECLSQLKKQTEFAKDPQRIERLKKHIQEIVAEFFTSGDIDEAVRCTSEMDTPFYTHEVVKRIVSTALDKGNRERELTSQFLAKGVGDVVPKDPNTVFPIPRKNCELGFIILLQRVEDLYKDVPDVLELLSSFVGRAIVDEVLPPRFVENVDLLETDMGYAVIKHVQHLLSGAGHTEQLLNVWGANSSKSIASMKSAISVIIKEYLVSRELDEALTAIQELDIPMFHHEIVKQLIPAVADYYVAKDLKEEAAAAANDVAAADADNKPRIIDKLNVPGDIADKAIHIQLAVDLISTALQHNIMAVQQIRGGFKRLQQRMDDYKLDSPLIVKYFECIAAQFTDILGDKGFHKNDAEQKENASTFVGGAKEIALEENEELRRVVEESKNLVLQHAKKQSQKVTFGTYKVVQCKTQTVAGINYLLKIRVDDAQHIHVFVWRKLDRSLELLGVDWNKSESDALVFSSPSPSSYASSVSKQSTSVRKVGGLKGTDLDAFVVNACKAVQSEIVSRAQKGNVKQWTPMQAKSQVVAGTNLFVKVKIDDNRFIHIRVWCKLDRSIELTDVQW
eukprot:CAMPEP_0202706326 /NCGR_PEP_ID=MMETSP1385-20130828/18757_1 /ASSEMBLY_ACC=CAM_ASM_000861 /TAXON_ID=933848 /ORGANISM="Elphidium margaritaceum" /LENGTH=789 /DNA_ID=CAMNT_0049364767 /DNA_START=36 /DNA_END=2402 /DNA_ORIENTATION=-